MKISVNAYSQSLDFEDILKSMQQLPEGDDVLRDTAGINQQQMDFFKQLTAATKTSELSSFDTDTVIASIDALFSCTQLSNYVLNSMLDASILASSDNLKKNMNERKLVGRKRIL